MKATEKVCCCGDTERANFGHKTSIMQKRQQFSAVKLIIVCQTSLISKQMIILYCLKYSFICKSILSVLTLI